MKTIETVYSKLNSDKTELGTHKVELNKIDDTIKEGAKIGGKILGIESDILSLANKIKSLSNGYNKYISDLKKYKEIAKELGENKLLKDADEAITFYEKKLSKANKMLENVKEAIKR